MKISDMEKNLNTSFDKSLEAQKAQIQASYDKAMAAYQAQLADAPEVYQTLKNEAYTNNALLEKARKESVANMGLSSAGGTSQTFQQRNTNALLSTLGDVSRQQQDYTNEINLALANLGAQNKADLTSLLAQTESERNAALLSQGQWQADHKLAQQQLDQSQQQLDQSQQQLGQSQQDLDRRQQEMIYNLAWDMYAKRKIKRRTFEALTGLDI